MFFLDNLKPLLCSSRIQATDVGGPTCGWCRVDESVSLERLLDVHVVGIDGAVSNMVYEALRQFASVGGERDILRIACRQRDILIQLVFGLDSLRGQECIERIDTCDITIINIIIECPIPLIHAEPIPVPIIIHECGFGNIIP